MMQDLVNLIVQNGLAVVIIAYFLFKDYKFNGQLIDLMTQVNNTLAILNEKIRDDKE